MKKLFALMMVAGFAVAILACCVNKAEEAATAVDSVATEVVDSAAVVADSAAAVADSAAAVVTQ
jgi:tRNA C32,U32 (ribose-2'-O)-methylase TrmJ